ncbi:MAG: Rpn family recombination-promoting nuclease/putative transposase [Treponema sp.]|nr:Rpn family recombination-promoting nuclease/putative transposase [Treponema sp.]
MKNEYTMEKGSLRYWALEYVRHCEGEAYIKLPPVIVINMLDFAYIRLEDFHTSFHIYEDRNKDYRLTDILEMHYIEMVKWRKVRDKDLNEPLHRWMVYFDELSGREEIEEVVKMDRGIGAVQEKMDMILRDPGLLHAYEMHEMARIDFKLGLQGARQEGRQEGRQEEKVGIARNLKAMGIGLEQISRATGLSVEEITRLEGAEDRGLNP